MILKEKVRSTARFVEKMNYRYREVQRTITLFLFKQFKKKILRYAVPCLKTFNPCSTNINGALHL